MSNEIIEVSGSAMMEAINRSEIDMQIATAHRIPRNIAKCKENMIALAAMDDTIAYNCFYHLEREDKKTGEKSIIEGPSVRFTEIISACWTNLRVAGRIIANDGKTITAQGVCHDLETNVAYSTEVKRSICGKYGTFSQDMQVVVGNAAVAIAQRNAICKVVPQVLIKSVVKEVQEKAKEHIAKIGVEESWKQWVAYLQTNCHVSEGMMLEYLGKKREDLGVDDIQRLVGAYNAIQEGSFTVEETFKKPKEQKQQAQAMQKAAEDAQQKAQQAMSRSQGNRGTAKK